MDPLSLSEPAPEPASSADAAEGALAPTRRGASAARGRVFELRAAAQAGAIAAVAGALAVGAAAAGAGPWTAVAVVLIAAAGVAGFAGLRARTEGELARRLAVAVEQLREGRLADPIETEGLASLTRLAEGVNELFAVLSDATTPALEQLVRLELIPERAVSALASVGRSAGEQEGAVEELASLMSNINNSIRHINDRVDTLSSSAEEASSSIIEMGSAIESVAKSTGDLTEVLASASSSVTEMGASIRQVSNAANEVQGMTEETASAMVEIDRSVNEVDGHVREAAALTQTVVESASEGSRAVTETIDDIGAIEARTRQAREVVEDLARRIGEISKIVTVIDDISDETNLLSLNAAIIAAQAGDHGKAFLVVANHVKTLARRTTASTKDIEELIRGVQRESDNAVEAMGAGIAAIEQGVARSRAAGEALDAIRNSATSASERVSGIARGSAEQARSSKSVADAAQRTSTQMQQITLAIAEQLRASDQLLASHEQAREACEHVHRSTEEQRASGRYIRESTGAILEMIRQVQENAANHARASEAVAESVSCLLSNAQASRENLPELHELMDDLRRHAQATIRELSGFQAGARGV